MQVFPEYTSPVMGALEQKLRQCKSVNGLKHQLPVRSGAPLKEVKGGDLVAEFGVEEHVAWTTGLVLPNVILVPSTVHEIVSRRHVACAIIEVKTVVTLGRMKPFVMGK